MQALQEHDRNAKAPPDSRPAPARQDTSETTPALGCNLLDTSMRNGTWDGSGPRASALAVKNVEPSDLARPYV
ncbi:hypothetical protein C4K40_3441 [Pseudomonas sp. CMR5c]|nr:hypothetical protein C4K40_3441 [Pseudomonas sp. CMR5c]